MHADLLILADWVLPVDAADSQLERYAVAVRDGRILAVLPAAEARSSNESDRTV